MTDRATRRRREAASGRPGGVAISPVALRAPQHYHVTVFVYSHEKDGAFQHSTSFEDIVTNDVQLAVSQALRDVSFHNGPPRKEYHVRTARQCHDGACLEGVRV